MNLDEYYKRLDLPLTASQADVKRAYRRLRAKYHPDRNKGRESTVEPVFKRIQEAFEILTGKRKPPVVSAESQSAPVEPQYRDAPARDPRSGPAMRGANCLVELFVPLEAAIHGGDVEVSYAVNGPCRQCQQRGSECAQCYGSGQSVSGKRCSACGGTGRPPASDRCPMCLGSGVGTYRKSESVKVSAGAWDGQRLVVEGGGHPGANGGPWGDAIFSVVIVCGAEFHRSGLNLASEIQVDFVTATLGGSIETQIFGRTMQIAIPANAHAGTAIRLPEHGLADRNGLRGDLTLQLVLAMPAAVSHLTNEERQELREMFADAERRATQVTTSR